MPNMWGVVSKYGEDIVSQIDSMSYTKHAVLGAVGGAGLYALSNDSSKPNFYKDMAVHTAVGTGLSLAQKKFATSIYAKMDDKFARGGFTKEQFAKHVASAGEHAGEFKGHFKAKNGDVMYEFENRILNTRTGKTSRNAT